MPVTKVKSKWSSGNLIFYEAVAGNGNYVQFGESGSGMDMKLFGATADAFMLWDESLDKLTFDKADIQLGDTDLLRFGDLAAGDITMNFDATNFEIEGAAAATSFLIGAAGKVLNTTLTGKFTIGVDNTGYDVQLFGATASAHLLWDESADELLLNGDSRLNFSSNTVKAGNTDGGIIKAGTSGTKIVEDTANMKFMSFYFDNGATSGDNRGMYLRQYLTGAGGGGEAARIFTTVEDVAAGTAHGAHISLNFGTSGTVTGQGIANRCTLHIPSTALTSNVTMAAVEAEIYSDTATSDPGGSTKLSCFYVVNGGDATGMADVDDDAVLFDFSGWTAATGNMIYDITGGAPANTDGSIKIRLPDGNLAYLMYYNSEAA